MNQLTDTIELAKKAGVVPLRIDGLEAFRALVIEAEHKRLMGVGMEPVGYTDASWLAQQNGGHFSKQKGICGNIGIYTADQLAAARLQDQQARQQAQIENKSLKARIARADVEKAREVLPLKKRIAELDANLKRATAALKTQQLETTCECKNCMNATAAIEAAHGIGDKA